MKTTPLPSVEEEVEKYEEEAGNFSSVALIINSVRANAILTQRDNQAYTRLEAGIKVQVEDINGESSVFDDFATDIIENVVKPLYGKE